MILTTRMLAVGAPWQASGAGTVGTSTRDVASSDAGQSELAAPAGEENLSQTAMRRVTEVGVGGDDRLGLAPRFLEERAVAHQVGEPELGQPRLPRAEEFAGAAQLQVDLGNLEAVRGRDHRLD